MSTKQILTRFILGVAFLLAVTAAAEAQTPSGSVAFETAEASAMGDPSGSAVASPLMAKSMGAR